ncbi:MAG: cadherin-like domain-containing protein [Saprospiraceae bacterium]
MPEIKVRYQPIQNFYVSLISPTGTEVRLYDGTCFTTDIVNVGFDDEAPNDLVCPPDDLISFRPFEPLSAFDGESTLGIWQLKVKVEQSGFGSSGQIGDWTIEFCADGNAVSPTLLTNDTLFVPPLMSNTITQNLLKVSDSEQAPAQLTYTLVSVPAHGILYRNGAALSPGSTFTQATIDAFNLVYQHEEEGTIYDGFQFVVQDGTGGFLPVQRFVIKMDENAVVGTTDLVTPDQFSVFPNPVGSQVVVAWPQPVDDRHLLRVFHSNGQLVAEQSIAPGQQQALLDTNNWPSGVFIISAGGISRKVVKM